MCAMIRQYRAFEDLHEPCFLVLEPEWITVSYQMKSILCQWRWDEIKELVPKRLGSRPPGAGVQSQPTVSHSQTAIKPQSPDTTTPGNRELRRNLLRIEFLQPDRTAADRFKWYRFESRELLDEFLAEATRLGYLQPLVTSHWLWCRKLRYLPAARHRLQPEAR